jgi:hypothetical protein
LFSSLFCRCLLPFYAVALIVNCWQNDFAFRIIAGSGEKHAAGKVNHIARCKK